jgi:hypothetical protein
MAARWRRAINLVNRRRGVVGNPVREYARELGREGRGGARLTRKGDSTMAQFGWRGLTVRGRGRGRWRGWPGQ